MQIRKYFIKTVVTDDIQTDIALGPVGIIPVIFRTPVNIPLLFLPGDNGESAFYVSITSTLCGQPGKRRPEIEEGIFNALTEMARSCVEETGVNPLWFAGLKEFEGWDTTLKTLLGNYAQLNRNHWGVRGELTLNHLTVGAWPGLTFGAFLMHSSSFFSEHRLNRRSRPPEITKQVINGHCTHLPLNRSVALGSRVGRLTFGFAAEPDVFRSVVYDPGVYGSRQAGSDLAHHFMPKIPLGPTVLALAQYIAWIYGGGQRPRPASSGLVTSGLTAKFSIALPIAPTFMEITYAEQDFEAVKYVRGLSQMIAFLKDSQIISMDTDTVVGEFQRYFELK